MSQQRGDATRSMRSGARPAMSQNSITGMGEQQHACCRWGKKGPFQTNCGEWRTQRMKLKGPESFKKIYQFSFLFVDVTKSLTKSNINEIRFTLVRSFKV